MDTLAQAHSSGPERTYVLEVLNGMLGARLAQADITGIAAGTNSEELPMLTEYQTSSSNTMSTSFSSFRDRLLEIYHEGIAQIINTPDTIADLSHCLPAIKGLELLFRIPSYLSDSEKGMIVSELVQIALTTDQKDDIVEQSVLALGTISGLQPQLFQTVILPAVLKRLPDQLSEDVTERESQSATIISLLESLVRISSSSSNVLSRQSNFAAFEEILIRKLVQTLSVPGQQQYQHAILASVSAWFEFTTDNQPASKTTANTHTQDSEQDQFSPISFLLSHIVEKRNVDGQDYVYVLDTIDDAFVRFVGDYLMRSLRTKSQSASPIARWDRAHPNSASAVWTLFTSLDHSDFIAAQANLISAPENQNLANALSMSLVAGIQSEVRA